MRSIPASDAMDRIEALDATIINSARAQIPIYSVIAVVAAAILFGGLLGCLLALPVNGMATSTTNFASFSEIAFRFLVTPPMLLAGMIFAALMGAIGGFFPSRNAAKRVIVEALRQV